MALWFIIATVILNSATLVILCLIVREQSKTLAILRGATNALKAAAA